jgi:hypothetical protein
MIRTDKLYLACLLGFLLELWCFPKISYSGNPIQDNILGNWQALYRECENEIILNITDTYIITGSLSFLMKHSYIITDSVSCDGSIPLKLYNTQYSSNNGLDYFEAGSETDTIKASIFLEKDVLILLIWKGGSRIGEFEIAAAYKRKNESEVLINQPIIHSIFYLPDSYTGYAWVAMAQPDGKPTEKDVQGREVFHIPESGLLLTQSKPMPTALAKREFAFYFVNNGGDVREEISVLSHDCVSFFKKQEFSGEQINEYGFDYDQIYVYYYRYNNPSREKINKFFEKDIKGQVFWFRVDTLKNLLKIEPMLPRFHSIENN